MGNTGSNGGRRRNHHNNGTQTSGGDQALPPPARQQTQEPPPLQENSGSGNRYVFAAATPYPSQYPNQNPQQYYHYPGYYPPPPPPPPLPAPFLHHHLHHRAGNGPQGQHHNLPRPPPHLNSGGGRYPPGPMAPVPTYIEHQRAVTIRNNVNLKKETLRVELDEENPGRFLVAFTFDATVAGSISIMFFAKEGSNCNLTPTKENLLQPVMVPFKEGLGQGFKQPPGAGIDFLAFDDLELLKEGEAEVYPLMVKAEAFSTDDNASTGDNQNIRTSNSQITQAVFEKKENGEYHVRVVKQILWVNDIRYELQEIYGIGNSIDNDFDGNDPAKECVICLSEPRDTTVLPCRHMCMCSECAKVLRYQTNRCPICRQPVERLLEIKVNNNNNKPEEQKQSTVPAE